MEGYTIYLEYAIICQCILPELETWAIFAYKLEEIGSLQFGAFTGIHGGLCNPKLMGHWNSWMS